MKALVLKVEGLAGNMVQNIARDMIRLAGLLDVMVECNVNGVTLLAVTGTTIADLERQYKKEAPDAAP